MTLLGNRFAPTTFIIGFLEGDLAAVVRADTSWRDGIGRYTHRTVGGDLGAMLRQLEPLSAPLTRSLWVQTNSNWTAYFDNSINGSDPFGPISYLSRCLGCRGLILSCCPDIPDQVYGQTRFDVYGQSPADQFNCTRVVAATNDGGRWSWDLVGEPLAFEETEAYSRKRIRDRFTPDMAVRYCSAFGVNSDADGFYGQSGCLVENLMIARSRCRTETYAQAKTRLGDRGAQPTAPPNGGPAESFGTVRAGGGPPSVS